MARMGWLALVTHKLNITMDMRAIIDVVRLSERAHRVNDEVNVIENPTIEQLHRLLADGPVSGLLAPRDRLFIWPAAIARHGDVLQSLGLDKLASVDLDMLADGPVVRGTSRHYRMRAAQYIEHAAAMHHLYGPHVIVQGLDRA